MAVVCNRSSLIPERLHTLLCRQTIKLRLLLVFSYLRSLSLFLQRQLLPQKNVSASTAKTALCRVCLLSWPLQYVLAAF